MIIESDMEAPQQYLVEPGDGALLQRPHSTVMCGQWPCQPNGPWANQPTSDTGTAPMDCSSQAALPDMQFDRTRHLPPSFGHNMMVRKGCCPNNGAGYWWLIELEM